MTTKLDGKLRRELNILGKLYTLTNARGVEPGAEGAAQGLRTGVGRFRERRGGAGNGPECVAGARPQTGAGSSEASECQTDDVERSAIAS